MYAIIESCGKQYKVAEGDVVFFEKLDTAEGKKVTFDKVILVSNEGKVEVGNPYVKSMKVVLLADLHMGYSIGVDQIEKMVKLVNEQKPDLVCIAGDIYDNDYNSLEDPDKLANLLSQMKSTYGTYACWGNHDVNQKILAGFTFSTGKTLEHDKRMDSFFKKAKINLLTDEVKLIDNKFYIAGRLDDEKPATGEVKKSADELLKGLDKSKPIFTISDGCIETPPILIQLYAPFILCAKSLVATSTITEAIATGIRSFTTLSISLSTQSITINTAIPIITAAS